MPSPSSPEPLPAERVTAEVGPPERSELGAAGRVLAAAFVDDPVWTAIGPHRRGHRAFANRFAFWGIVQGSVRNSARIRVARSPVDGSVAGVTIAFADGAWPIPESATLWEAAWFFAAGPWTVRRGLRDDATMRRHHIEHPHNYLWFVGVDPAHQGQGIGRTLMAELHEWSEPTGLPVYLETGTPSNVDVLRLDGLRGDRRARPPKRRPHVAHGAARHGRRPASVGLGPRAG